MTLHVGDRVEVCSARDGKTWRSAGRVTAFDDRENLVRVGWYWYPAKNVRPVEKAPMGRGE